jgi:hypothetical protein
VSPAALGHARRWTLIGALPTLVLLPTAAVLAASLFPKIPPSFHAVFYVFPFFFLAPLCVLAGLALSRVRPLSRRHLLFHVLLACAWPLMPRLRQTAAWMAWVTR